MAQGPPCHKGPPAPQKKIFLGYLIVIYIGNQITDIYAIRYHTSTVHGWFIGYYNLQIVILYAYDVRHYQLHIYRAPRNEIWKIYSQENH